MKKLGNTDIEISSVIMGTWQAGKDMWSGIEDHDSILAIKAAYGAGITTFDTASMYGDGHSERLLGEVVKSVRDKVIIATKVFSNQLRHDDVITSCNTSLKNLQTDYIDLYQIHWPAGSFASDIVPLEETMGALNLLKEQGKIRAIGVSNFSLSQLEEACQHSEVASIQPPYSLFWRHIAETLQPYCTKNNITILAYSPLAQGLLTGRFKPGHKFNENDNRIRNKLFQPDNFERAWQAIEQLRPIAIRNQITLANLAIAWLLCQPMTCTVVGARNAEQVKNNAHAMGIILSEADQKEIDNISRLVTDHISKTDSLTHDW